MRVTILGAGIIGICSAWYLRKAGFEVTVIDRQPEPALETSFANGGQVSVSQSEPWANPDAPRQIFNWLWHDDAPLLFRPRLDPKQWAWALRFLQQCLPGANRRNTRQLLRLGLYSRETLQALRDETGIQYDQGCRGILQIYFDHPSFDAAVETAALMRQQDCLREPLNPEQAIAIEPALANLRGRLVGATYAKDDESGDARLFTQQLAKLAEAAGVEFRFNTCIRSLEIEDGDISGVRILCSEGRQHILRSDRYLVCLGSYTAPLLAQIGISLPIYPTKGYSVTMSTAGHVGAPHVSITDETMRMVYSRLGERIRIAGTAELCGFDTELNDLRCESLIRRYFSLFPDSADINSAQFWTGLRPSTPSNVPIIGQSRYRSLYINAGHGTLGWTEGPGSGRAIAGIIAGTPPDIGFDFIQGGR
ncbi:D-amino acid dehydrogenase [Chitinimonas sp.]|uniref:D-amino acid dehydrogenase n=1 Tax=Chitinimonas sp. TaxID=1934313 RepID=UPI0035B047ED